MKVLVACESSGVVRDAFKRRGHTAMSCDLLESDSPGLHYVGNALDIINDGWDLIIAHPPCTYPSSSGMHWTTRGLRDPKLTEDALGFVRAIMDADCDRIAIENPVGCISTRIRPADQYIHPYQFGHDASKKTGLWLKGLPLLKPTKYIEPTYYCCGIKINVNAEGIRGCPNCEGDKKAKPRWGNQTASGQNKLPPSKDRWKQRSITYSGIAEAMADQWR